MIKALIVNGAFYTEKNMPVNQSNTEAKQTKLFFAFPQDSDASTIETFKSNELAITPVMFAHNPIVVSTTLSDQSAEALNTIGSGAQAIINAEHLMKLESALNAININIRSGQLSATAVESQIIDNEDGSKKVKLVVVIGSQTKRDQYNEFFKIYLRTSPFTAFIDQETNKLIVDADALESITVEELLTPELHVTDTDGNIIHPETYFNMRHNGERHPDFNLETEKFKRAIYQVIKLNGDAWLLQIRSLVKQVAPTISIT